MRRSVVFLAVVVTCTLAIPAMAQERIVGVGGSITEILFALGAGDRMVARDSTSGFPAEALALPSVGYVRSLAPEGVLSVRPDLIIAENDAGPPEAVALLKEAAIPMVVVEEDFSAEGIAQKILTIGKAADLEAEAKALADKVRGQIAEAQARAQATAEAPKRVMFVLSARDGRIMGSGTNTSADAIIRMSGGINAITDFEGYKTLNAEAIIRAQPDVVLMMDRGGSHDASAETLFDLPAFATTPAATDRALIKMNGLFLLGFGPRTAEAINGLSDQLNEL